MERKIRVLVVTYHPWREDISVGNTLSNIFRGMEDKVDFFNIYIRDDKPSTKLVKRFFHISEKKMVKNMFTRSEVGEETFSVGESEVKEDFSKGYNKARKLRWDSLILAQDFLGLCCHWKSNALDEFIRDIKPDLVFGPMGRLPLTNIILFSISKKYDIPLVAYPWDDHYSMKKYSWSPIFWSKMFLERHYIRKCAHQSTFLYTITSLMATEYRQYFHKECRLLYKGYSFKEKPHTKDFNGVMQITYMGNIGAERWKTLIEIVDVVNKLNQGGVKYKLDLYTLSPISDEVRNKLNQGECHLRKPVPSSEIMSTLQKADVLLHVEPESLKEKLMFRLSFSTKIVDYLFNAKCILAVGEDTGTINYLKENACAITVKNGNDVKPILCELYNHPDRLQFFGEKAWECGEKNHDIHVIQDRVYQDFLGLKTNK